MFARLNLSPYPVSKYNFSSSIQQEKRHFSDKRDYRVKFFLGNNKFTAEGNILDLEDSINNWLSNQKNIEIIKIINNKSCNSCFYPCILYKLTKT